jgi:NADH:ubiquinone oxidoreductase subunit C
VEANGLLPKLQAGMPGAVLETGRFGRGGEPVAWAELKKLAKLAKYLREELGLDWLENLSVAQLDDALVLTYFLRSTVSREELILRVSLVPADARTEVEAPSLAETWPQAGPMEQEASELFGVRFEGAEDATVTSRRLPKGWNGYPLRKSYVFPREVDGIAHARPRGVDTASDASAPPAEEIQP